MPKYSIEQNIERIADALEALASYVGKGTAPVAMGGAPAEAKTSVIQPPQAAPVATPGTISAAAPVQDAIAVPANSEQLRALAASIAQDLGKDAKTAPKVLGFTNWVSTMLQPYGVAKLVDVRPEHIAPVAREIYAWAKKEGVNV